MLDSSQSFDEFYKTSLNNCDITKSEKVKNKQKITTFLQGLRQQNH